MTNASTATQTTAYTYTKFVKWDGDDQVWETVTIQAPAGQLELMIVNTAKGDEIVRTFGIYDTDPYVALKGQLRKFDRKEIGAWGQIFTLTPAA